MKLEFDGDCLQAAGIELPIVVINLPHRADRWLALTSRMRAVGLNKLIRAPAVVGAQLSAAEIARLLETPATDIDEAPKSHLRLTRPAIGCFLSHIGIWRWVIENNVPRVLVFEDDAAPAVGFDPARFAAVVSSIPKDVGLVFLGCLIMDGLADEPGSAELARIFYFNGTFAYVITLAGCRYLIEQLMPPHWHIDHQISKVLFERRQDFPAYYAVPRLFEADWSLGSDCFVPLAEETHADNELRLILSARRRHLLDEGRPLLPPFVKSP